MTPRAMSLARILAVSILAVPAIVAGQAAAQAPREERAPSRPAPPQAAERGYDAAREAFEALPEAARKGVQDALIWTGDFNAGITGGFGRRTYEAILSWQRREGRAANGLLGKADRAALDAAAANARRAIGFAVRRDPATGAAIGIPERILPKRSALPRGTRWQSADERISLDTLAAPADEADLDALYERAAASGPARRVTYRLKRPDFFVVTGETPTGRFYIRQASGAQGVRGFSVSYDKALAEEVDRLVIAIANSFTPFPGVEAAPATAPSRPEPADRPAAPALPGTAAAPAATGLRVAPGRVLTSAAALQDCAVPRIGGAPARVALRDPVGTLVLLEAQGSGPAGYLPPLRAEAPPEGEALVVPAAGAKAPLVAPGVAVAGGLAAPLQPGAGGAPILDRSGRLVGLVALFPVSPRLVAGVMPPTRYALVPAQAVAAFLAQAGIAVPRSDTVQATTLGAAAAPVLGALAAIDCGR